jgi:hypothetical protein
MEVRPGRADVAQHRHFEHEAIFFALRDIEAPSIDCGRARGLFVRLEHAELRELLTAEAGARMTIHAAGVQKQREPCALARIECSVVAAQELVEAARCDQRGFERCDRCAEVGERKRFVRIGIGKCSSKSGLIVSFAQTLDRFRLVAVAE